MRGLLDNLIRQDHTCLSTSTVAMVNQMKAVFFHFNSDDSYLGEYLSACC